MGINDTSKLVNVNLKGGNFKPDIISPKAINNIYEIKSPKESNNINNYNYDNNKINYTEGNNYNSIVDQSGSLKNKKIDKFLRK
jgi:hypothetical protein